jgi:hypothetical protein
MTDALDDRNSYNTEAEIQAVRDDVGEYLEERVEAWEASHANDAESMQRASDAGIFGPEITYNRETDQLEATVFSTDSNAVSPGEAVVTIATNELTSALEEYRRDS